MNAKLFSDFDLWVKYLSDLLKQTSFRDSDVLLKHDEAFRLLKKMTLEAKEGRSTIHFIGNGASSSMASHISADLCKNGEVSTMAYTDASILTAMANDCGVEICSVCLFP